MNDDTPPTVADMIPRKFRRGIYGMLTAVFGLQLIWHVLPERYDGRIATTLAFLGFGMATTFSGPSTTVPADPAQED